MVFLAFSVGVTHAATITWDGGGSTNDWSEGANWTGAPDNTAPTSADIATFSSTSTKDATVDAGFAGSVLGVDINSGYTGTITQSRSLTIGSTGFDQAAGIYTASGQSIDINDGGFVLSSGAFTAPSTMDIERSFNVSGGTFTHNSGTVTFNGTSSGDDTTITCGASTFYLVVIDKVSSGDVIVNSGCTLPLGNSAISGSGATGAIIINNGNITVGTGTWTIRGSYTQNTGSTLTFTGTTIDLNGGAGGGDMTLSDGTFTASSMTTFSLEGDLANTANILPSNLNMTIDGNSTGHDSSINCGTATFSSITAGKSSTGDVLFASNCTTGGLTYSGGLFLNTASAYTIFVTGAFSQTYSSSLGGSNLTIEFSGSSAQTISKTAGTFSSIFKVNKSGSNAASLSTPFTTSTQACTVAAGIFDLNGKDFTCGSTFTVQNGGTLKLLGNEISTTPTLDSGSTVTYKGDGDGSADTYGITNWSYQHLTTNFTDSQDILSPSVDLSSNLHSYWKMNDSGVTETDYSGNSRTLTVNGTTSVSGQYGNARDLNGTSSDFMSLASPSLPTGDFTYSAWINPDSNTDEAIFMVSNGSGGNEFFVYLNGSNQIDVYVDGSVLITSTATISTVTWTHIAVTRVGSLVTLYINGSIDSIGTNSATLSFSTCSLFIGIDYDTTCSGTPGNYFDGKIDEARIYTRGLGTKEIQAIYNNSDVTPVASITALGNFAVSAGSFTSPASLNLAGNFTNSSTFNHNSGTVTFNGSSGTKTLTSGSTSFYNLTINDSGGTLTLEIQDPLDVNNNLTITGGTLDAKSGGNHQINVGNNWSNSDGFTARSGLVVLDGGDQTIAGATTFNNLTKNITTPARTLTFPAGALQTISGTLNLSGTSGNLLSLRSSSTPTQWQINPQGTRTISYLDVKDSYNTNATPIQTSGNNITNSLNNTGWNFNAPSATTPSSISQSSSGTGYITFSTIISDSDNDNTRVKVEYSDDNGTSWYDPVLVSVSPSSGTTDLDNANSYQIGTSNPVDTSGGSITLTIVWNTKSASNGNGSLDNTDQTDIKVRVTPNDTGVDGSVATSAAFEVDNQDPTSFASLSVSSVTQTTASLSWTMGSETNFDHYEFWYGTNQTTVENRTATEWDGSDDSNLTTISTSSTTITGLSAATTYYFHGWAIDDYGNELESSTVSDTTSSSNASPSIPSSLGSSALVGGGWITDSTPTFSFTLSDSDTGDTVKFKLQVDDNSDFSSTVVDYTSSLAAQGSTLYTLTTALGDGSYYWRVKAIDENAAESTYSTANSGSVAFKLDSTNPSTPELDSPSDNSYTSSAYPGFKWKISSDSGSGISSYFLEVDGFTISDIPSVRTTDYETDNYKAEYSGDYITVYTKGSKKLTEGKKTWTIKAHDNAGNVSQGNRNLYADFTAPSVTIQTVNNVLVTSQTVEVSDRTPTLIGLILDSQSTSIASGPKSISVRIDKIVTNKNKTSYTNIYNETITLNSFLWSSDDSRVTDNSINRSGKYAPFSYLVTQNLGAVKYRVTVDGQDQAGNTSVQQTFIMDIFPESQGTEIFGVRAIDIATDSARIIWNTNHKATSKVNYGKTPDYGQTILSRVPTESHSILITDLDSGSKYYYEVISSGNTTAFDAQHIISTLSVPISPTPIPTLVPLLEPVQELIQPVVEFVAPVTQIVEEIRAYLQESVIAITVAATSQISSGITVAVAGTVAVVSVIEAGIVASTLVPPATQLVITSPQTAKQFASGAQQFISSVLASLGLIKRKRKSYGLVVDSVSNLPLSNAYLLFYSSSGNLQIAYSGIDGRFSLSAPSDSYQIKAEKIGYTYPSQILTVSENATYTHIYRPSDKVEVINEPLHHVVIPMDPTTNISSFLKAYLKVKNFLSYIFVSYHSLITGFGLVLSSYSSFVHPNTINQLTFVLYIFAFMISLKYSIHKKSWGTVYLMTGQPANKILIQLYKTEGDREELFTSTLTDDQGRYLLKPDPGSYTLKILDSTFSVMNTKKINIRNLNQNINHKIVIPHV